MNLLSLSIADTRWVNTEYKRAIILIIIKGHGGEDWRKEVHTYHSKINHSSSTVRCLFAWTQWNIGRTDKTTTFKRFTLTLEIWSGTCIHTSTGTTSYFYCYYYVLLLPFYTCKWVLIDSSPSSYSYLGFQRQARALRISLLLFYISIFLCTHVFLLHIHLQHLGWYYIYDSLNSR